MRGVQRAVATSQDCTLCMLAALTMLFSIAGPATAQAPGPLAITRLESAIELYPDDPDLNWALTRKLAGSGQATKAVRRVRDFLARWPTRRPDARVEIARSLIDAGVSAEAHILLDEELRQNPRSPVARFYRGIAFRADGLVAESNREFRIAGELEPSLRPETYLARALGLFDLGQEAEAVDLLRMILEIDPGSETAIRARLLLRQREVLSLERPWRLDAYAGFEWDSNVLLDSAQNEVPASDLEDFLGVWGLGGTYRVLSRENGSLTVGYRFDQSMHDDLDQFDLLTNTGIVSGSWRLRERIILRGDGLVWNTRQDGNDELTGGSLRPSLIYSFGPDWGALRTFGQFEVLEYGQASDFEFFERDGITFGGGLEHFIPLPLENSWASLSGSYQRTLTQAETSGGSDGFDGDYDYDSGRVRALAVIQLPFEVRARAEAGYSHDDYHNDNFAYALTTFPTPRIRKREDDVVSGRFELSRQIVDHVEFEAYWRGTWRMSNISFFDYDRHVVGALVRVSTH